jgi:hypothetical protein
MLPFLTEASTTLQTELLTWPKKVLTLGRRPSDNNW